MKQEDKVNLYGYLRNYIIQMNKHDDYINYYELFGLDRNLSISELKRQIKEKKIQKLFHPDQEMYIEDFFKPFFQEGYGFVPDMIQIFSDEEKKVQYDNMLDEKISVNKDEQVEIDEKEALEEAIVTTIKKYGLNNGYLALQYSLKGDFSRVTRDNGNRYILGSIGKDKIMEIVNGEEENVMEENKDNIVADYLNKITNKSLVIKEKIDSFYNVCMETIKEKDMYPTSFDLDNAIYAYIEEGYPDLFSNGNNARDEFLNNNIYSEDVIVLMNLKIHSSLGKDDSIYLFSNMIRKPIEEQCKVFSSIMKKEVEKQQNQTK